MLLVCSIAGCGYTWAAMLKTLFVWVCVCVWQGTHTIKHLTVKQTHSHDEFLTLTHTHTHKEKENTMLTPGQTTKLAVCLAKKSCGFWLHKLLQHTNTHQYTHSSVLHMSAYPRASDLIFLFKRLFVTNQKDERGKKLLTLNKVIRMNYQQWHMCFLWNTNQVLCHLDMKRSGKKVQQKSDKPV